MGDYEDRQERRRLEESQERRRREDALWRRNLCPCGLMQMVGGQCTMCITRSGSSWDSSAGASPADETARPGPFSDDGALGEQATARYDPPLDPQDWAEEVAEAREQVSHSSALEDLWERAVAGCEDEQQQRRRYWMLINEDQGPTAGQARELLVRAGYELGRETQPGRVREDVVALDRRPTPDEAPMTPDTEFRPGCVGCNGFLTIVGGLCLNCARQAASGLDPATQRDGGPGEREAAQRRSVQTEEERLRGRDLSNLCMNLDGPSVVGRLCSSCAAQLRGEESAMLRYQQAFTGYLAETDELRTLWQRATQTKRGETRTYDDSRDQFWKLVSTAPERDARFVRGMLQAGGFDMSPGRAPILRMNTGDRSPGRRRDQLQFDHASPRSKDKARIKGGLEPLATDAGNIRFMLGRDNMSRQDQWTAKDEPAVGWGPFWKGRALSSKPRRKR